MKIEFSVLSKYRSLVGIQVARNGAINRDDNDRPVFQSTLEVTFGFLFGYLSMHFNIGRAIAIDEMVTKYKEVI